MHPDSSSPQIPGSPAPLLLLGSSMATGGAQRVLLDQARWFSNHGYPVTAAFFHDREGLHDQYQAECPCPVLDLQAWKKGAGWKNIFRFPSAIWRLFRLLRRERFQVVATFTHHANLIGIPLAWLAGVPRRVATHHGQIEGLPNWMEWLHTQVINLGIASVLVAVSERVRRQAILKEGIHPELIIVIPNGIRAVQTLTKDSLEVSGLRAELGFQPSDHIFLTVGRLVTQKGHSFLLNAIPEVVAAFPNAGFIFVGDGPLRPELEDRVAALRIQNHVRFLGIRNDVPLLLSSANGFLLPSLWEGLPIALLEAMSAGLPVIATDVEGVDEVIQNGENGLLVPPADPAALAAAILNLLGDPNLRNRFALSGQALIAEKYAIDTMGANYEKLYLQGTIIA